MISLLINILLYSQPSLNFQPAEIATYNILISKIHDGQLIPKEMHFSRSRFLQYLALKGEFVFHGSNNLKIGVFEPREQTLFNGKLTKAVFASSEPMWSIFYAIFDRSKLVGSFRNGCLVSKNKKYHYYSLNKSTIESNPWTSGKIYIFPKDKFTLTDNGKVYFDEWICHDFVKPLTQLEVSAQDFFYINKVATHKDNESLIKTWLFYKIRTLRLRSKNSK